MTTYMIEIGFDAAQRDDEAFDAFLDRVLDELWNLGIEADYTASLRDWVVTFEIPGGARTTDDFAAVLVALRTALHAARCGTPGWPSAHQLIETRITNSNGDLVSA